MKRVLLLSLRICFCISFAHAQKFEYKVSENGETYEIRIKKFDKLFGAEFTSDKLAKLAEGGTEARDLWRKDCAKRLLDGDIRQLLGEIGDREGDGFWVTFYIDRNGSVLTVTFTMPATVYLYMPTKTLRELYNRATKETLAPSSYLFSPNHIYAVDAVELMKRVVEENKESAKEMEGKTIASNGED